MSGSLFSGRRRDDSPWIVLVEGLPAEEHRYRLAAEIARARLVVTRYFASRSTASDAARPNASATPDQPVEVRPVKRTTTNPAAGICATTHPRRYAEAVERELQLTYEGRT